ncbi:hypothetical protein T4B_9039 [Trichinella pseudospiralis]|uniref:G-protein coupled receptors family 1 profile domain-containing protein n=1 Tax=Trichinella pseudospiralis TaxID=6337 RepID=A0A0V1JD17_TRIPS|nr:hypothetical protein T4B_9039 [Trichinella pseudospiralis]KRZ46155.1 hypothetical protein T4C_3834 [Trichinella pseudospiralis]
MNLCKCSQLFNSGYFHVQAKLPSNCSIVDQKKEPDEFGNGKFEAHLFNSSREELLLYYEKTNTQFFFSGLVIMFLNALLLFLILKLRRRKKYFIIILSACISLLLHGAGYLTASLQRYLMFHLSWLLTETWKCSFWPHLLLFDLGDKGSCLFFFILTLDRFLTVIFSHYCKSFTAKSCSKLIISLYVMLILQYIPLVAWRCLGEDRRTIILGFCYQMQYFSADYYFYHCMIMAIIATLNLLLYIVCILLMLIKRSIAVKITSTFFDIQQRRENVVLKRLFQMMLCTLLIHAVPLILLFVSSMHFASILEPAHYFWVLQPIALSTHLFITCMINDEFHALFKSKLSNMLKNFKFLLFKQNAVSIAVVNRNNK